MRVKTKILSDLAFFLNSVRPDMKPAQWKEFLKAAKKRKAFADLFICPAFTERVTLAEAQALRAEITHDLAYRGKNPQKWFASLLGSLNRLELKTKYDCYPLRLYGKPRPGQIILKVGKNRFVPRVYPEARTPEELLYVTLGAALMDGTLDRLKTCLQCGKWTVGKNAGRKFCSDECKDAFNNRRRIEDGYFERYRKLRQRRAHRRVGQI